MSGERKEEVSEKEPVLEPENALFVPCKFSQFTTQEGEGAIWEQAANVIPKGTESAFSPPLSKLPPLGM